MGMEALRDKEVYFDKYCNLCVYRDLDEIEDPCNACLTQAYNENSHKPVKFKRDPDVKETAAEPTTDIPDAPIPTPGGIVVPSDPIHKDE